MSRDQKPQPMPRSSHMADLDTLRMLAGKATQGKRDIKGAAVNVYGRGTIAICPRPADGGVMEFFHNRALIAACDPQTILALLDENERLRAAIKESIDLIVHLHEGRARFKLEQALTGLATALAHP